MLGQIRESMSAALLARPQRRGASWTAAPVRAAVLVSKIALEIAALCMSLGLSGRRRQRSAGALSGRALAGQHTRRPAAIGRPAAAVWRTFSGAVDGAAWPCQFHSGPPTLLARAARRLGADRLGKAPAELEMTWEAGRRGLAARHCRRPAEAGQCSRGGWRARPAGFLCRPAAGLGGQCSRGPAGGWTGGAGRPGGAAASCRRCRLLYRAGSAPAPDGLKYRPFGARPWQVLQMGGRFGSL